MIELHVSDNDVTGGNIAVSWCLDKKTFEALKLNSKNPYIIIVVVPTVNYNHTKELRYLFPLKDVMGYISFKCSGTNKIIGIIDINEADDKDFIEKRYLRKEYSYHSGGSVYSSTLISSNGELLDGSYYESLKETGISLVSDAIEVEVPKECFAPEPAQWEKDWVNHLFRSKVFDQCDFRRRRLFAYSVQPVLMFFNIVLRLLLTVVAFLILARGSSLKYLFHPLMYSIGDTIDLFREGTFLLRPLPEDDKLPAIKGFSLFLFYLKRFLPLLLTPGFLLIILMLVYFGVLGTVLIAVGRILAVLGSAAVILTILVCSPKIKKFIENIFYNLIESKTIDYSDPDEQDALVCNGKVKIKLSDLPSRKRTFKLRFQNLKSKVCRPFSA